MKAINRSEGFFSKTSKIKSMNNKLLPKGININLFVFNLLTSFIAAGISLAHGWNYDITIKLALYSFITTQLIVYFTLNFAHIKNTLSIFSYLIVFSLQFILFMIVKSNYTIDYQIIDNSVKIIELNNQIKEIEALKLHKLRLEKQLNTYQSLNEQKQNFQNMTCHDAVNYVETFLEKK